MTQLVKRLTLDIGSDLDLMVISLSPILCSNLGVELTLNKQTNK